MEFNYYAKRVCLEDDGSEITNDQRLFAMKNKLIMLLGGSDFWKPRDILRQESRDIPKIVIPEVDYNENINKVTKHSPSNQK